MTPANPQVPEVETGRSGVVLVSGWSFPAQMWQGVSESMPDRSVTQLGWDELGDWLMSNGSMTPAIEQALRQSIWVGWSLGGALLVEAMAQGVLRPERALIVAAMPRFLEADGWPGVTLSALRGLRRQVRKSPAAALAGFDEWLGLPGAAERQLDGAMLERGLKWLGDIDRRDAIDLLSGQVDWLGGSADPLVHADGYQAVAGDRMRSLLVPAGGHGLPFTHADLICSWVRSGTFDFSA